MFKAISKETCFLAWCHKIITATLKYEMNKKNTTVKDKFVIRDSVGKSGNYFLLSRNLEQGIMRNLLNN